VNWVAEDYLLGVLAAILSGVVWNFGMVLQKKIVNDLWLKDPTGNRNIHLYKNPIWLLGVFLSLIIATIFFLWAQQMIGPALVPGLMSAGFIVLIIGSVKIIKVKLNFQELVGIGLVMLGIILLGFSELEINVQAINFNDQSFFLRAGIFSLILFGLWIGFFFSVHYVKKRKGIFKALSSALPLCISDFWICIAIATVTKFIAGETLPTFEVFLLLFSIVIVIGANIQNIRETQIAFRFADASIVIPIQQIPIQISPIFIYYLVFAMASPKVTSFLFILLGTSIIIGSGFLLSQRQANKELHSM
jgi:multidrug transporter EmrE-like cation transporter